MAREVFSGIFLGRKLFTETILLVVWYGITCNTVIKTCDDVGGMFNRQPLADIPALVHEAN